MILGIFGNVGKYKTAIATLIVYLYLRLGVPVYTNYTVDFPQYSHLLHRLSLSEILDLDIECGVIVVDEVYTVAESRISTSRINRFFSYFIFQSRKLKVHIIYTSQLTSAVDLRLFNLTDVKIACYGLQSDGRVKFTIVREVNGKIRKKIKRISQKIFITLIFGRYDTYESVDPLGIQELIVDIIKYDTPRLNARIDESIAKIIAEFPELNSRKVSKCQINDAMMYVGEPSNLATYVFDRLKSNLRPRLDKQPRKVSQKWWEKERQVAEKNR